MLEAGTHAGRSLAVGECTRRTALFLLFGALHVQP